MAGNKRPSFLKRQKEQQRMARAAEKRESRRLRKQAKRELDEAPALDLDPDPEAALSSLDADDTGGGPDLDRDPG